MKFYKGNVAAVRRYLATDHSAADDYYLKEGSGFAQRFTATPDTLTERDPMDGNTYEKWVYGIDVDTGAKKGRLRDDPGANRCLEVTINGPKTWSLAAALHPEVSRALDAAQEQAAVEIISYLAAHATTRVGGRGKQVQVPVEEIEAAVIRHYTSRAGDPHRHLHLQINSRIKAAGAWRGIHSVGVRDMLDAINGIGHASVLANPDFRHTLAEHGYSIDFDTGEVAELAPYVGAFSARTKQIGANIDRYEAQWRAEHPGEEPGPKLRQIWDRRAWADARPDKHIPTDGAELVQRWNHELADLGFTPPDGPVHAKGHLPGAFNRDGVAAVVLDRLGVKKSAWNAADIRGAVELLLAEKAVFADTPARTELAEDITARALDLSTALSSRPDVPEHLRNLTSQAVLTTETEIIGALAARGTVPLPPLEHAWTKVMNTSRPSVVPAAYARTVRGQAVTALACNTPLVVIEGAAGSGKTSILAEAQRLNADRGHRMLVVTPTRKAAEVAANETGATGRSAAWLAHQHGYRTRPDGTRYRDPEAVPKPDAVLNPGDLLVVDEAGMLDQDTAQALLAIADNAGARVAFIGDRHQLPAVGRGGVLDHAVDWAHPSCRFDLHEVVRFTDPSYVPIAGRMRHGQAPELVFDQLLARGQIVIHPTDIERAATLAQLAADGEMVIADTREQVGQINTAAAHHNHTNDSDEWSVVTDRGERLRLGDKVATRRNDDHLLVANRQTWVVAGINADGGLILHRPGHRSRPDVELPPDYAREHVELAYATTIHGAQGETSSVSHAAVGDTTGHAAAYVAMSRGRHNNIAHLVAENPEQARTQWVEIFGRDRADLGPAAARRHVEENLERYGPTASARTGWRPLPSPAPAAVQPEVPRL